VHGGDAAGSEVDDLGVDVLSVIVPSFCFCWRATSTGSDRSIRREHGVELDRPPGAR
jgi:hypothetical protein